MHSSYFLAVSLVATCGCLVMALFFNSVTRVPYTTSHDFPHTMCHILQTDVPESYSAMVSVEDSQYHVKPFDILPARRKSGKAQKMIYRCVLSISIECKSSEKQRKQGFVYMGTFLFNSRSITRKVNIKSVPQYIYNYYQEMNQPYIPIK